MSPYTFEFEDGVVREWTLTEEGAEPTTVADYAPSLFVAGPDAALADLQDRLETDPKVLGTRTEQWATSLHEAHADDRSRVLRVDGGRVDEVRTLAREIRGIHERETHAPGTFRLFDVDLAPGFRYCLDRDIDPTPDRDLRTLRLSLDEAALADGDISALARAGEPIDGDEPQVLRTLRHHLERRDPDVLVVSHAELVPTLERRAETLGIEFHLGRLPGMTKLASENTYASYGQVGHSPARYRVPGRAILDTSNSFLWHQSGLAGIRYMVERTGRPLQEAAWGSIGALLTSRQIRLARRRKGVLAPWNKWEPERFTDVETLHAADRGGFTFSPEVGFHEDVHEIDFASLYPRIICEHNVSPETVGCDCDGADIGHAETNPVPEIGYEICETDGFLPAVLEPLISDRAAIKRRLGDDPSDDEAARLRAESGAIKWVLVSSFGYQGYRNAKFGRIECHEAINAYARKIALTAKRRLEEAGWRIVHGIVDSLWVTPRGDEPEPLETVTADISETVGIPLEHDGNYEWVCFVPLRDSIGSGGSGGSRAGGRRAGGSASAGALTKYFGKRSSGGYKFRGIELRQRSTPAFVADSQRAFIEALDRERDPEAVCDVLGRRLSELREGTVDPADLTVTKRVSRRLADYSQQTHSAAALRRYERRGIDRHPGQSVEYVVADDDARGPERVRLALEEPRTYDADYYATLLVRACESVLSPLGWDRSRIRHSLRDGRTVRLSTFTD
ncbi:type B DNA-directed DNA polymerase [Natrinema halophilum]|uniref:DNA-directed DNA polymerase n=1 Tax=Natrinema halophilum TaxID=1699371 RepID=A0A7D5KSP9_9EURY|nr:type B DNA-directed DNA polymerase [Natrinema halophilum]QLG50557.1 type B DNA-directed DNA polymerase [Natrinema halophilum]